MKRKLKQLILGLLLSVSLILSGGVSTIYASETETEEEQKSNVYNDSLDNFLNWLLASCDIWYNYGVNEVENLKNAVLLEIENWDNFINNGDGTCTVSDTVKSEQLTALREKIAKLLEDQEPYRIYQPQGYSSTMGIAEQIGKFDNSSSYLIVVNYLKQFNGAKVLGEYGYRYLYLTTLDNSEYMYAYYDKANSRVVFVDKDLNNAYALKSFTSHYANNGATGANNIDPHSTFTQEQFDTAIETFSVYHNGLYYENSTSAIDSKYVLRPLGKLTNGNITTNPLDESATPYIEYYYGQPICVFDSLTDLVEWKVNQPIAFTSNNFYLPLSDLTIDPDTISKYDNELMQKIYEQLIENGKNAVSEAELRQIIQDTITSALNEINDNIEDLEDETANTNNILNKILTQLKDFQKSNEELLNEIVGNTKSDDETDKLKDDPTSIDMNMDFTQVTDVMKTKLPFSLPWDIYMVLKPFESENISAPYWEIPLKIYDEKIGLDIEYTLVIDMGTNGINDGNEIINLDDVAKIIRVMLSTIFTVGALSWLRKYFHNKE